MRAEFLCVSVLGVASGRGLSWLSGCFKLVLVCSGGRSRALVPVLVLVFIAL